MWEIEIHVLLEKFQEFYCPWPCLPSTGGQGLPVTRIPLLPHDTLGPVVLAAAFSLERRVRWYAPFDSVPKH